MKKTNLFKSLLLLVVVLFSQCSDNSEELAQTNLESTFSKSLPIDKTLINYVDQISNISNASLKAGADVDQLILDLNSITSEEDFNSKIDKYFVNSVELKKVFYDSRITSEKFWKVNSNLKELPIEKQTALIQNSIIEIAQRDFADRKIRNESIAGLKSPCQKQLDSDNQTCAEGSYVGAAFCGLLSPTLIGALGCGAGVVAADYVCHRAASRTYKNCLEAE